ncbi:hypothetical protein L218DRAFT_1002278 [Marasmius fiardii PR-910]|nr:hypothetical protein L218DRAFT_1002278 [Marasmius fiardii PR-910]
MATQITGHRIRNDRSIIDFIGPDDGTSVCQCAPKNIKFKAAVCCTRNSRILHVSLQSIIANFLPKLLVHSDDASPRPKLSIVNITSILPWCPPDPKLLQCCSLLVKSVFAACKEPELDPRPIAEVIVQWMKRFPPRYTGNVQPYLDQLAPYLEGLKDWKDVVYKENPEEIRSFWKQIWALDNMYIDI